MFLPGWSLEGCWSGQIERNQVQSKRKYQILFKTLCWQAENDIKRYPPGRVVSNLTELVHILNLNIRGGTEKLRQLNNFLFGKIKHKSHRRILEQIEIPTEAIAVPFFIISSTLFMIYMEQMISVKITWLFPWKSNLVISCKNSMRKVGFSIFPFSFFRPFNPICLRWAGTNRTTRI